MVDVYDKFNTATELMADCIDILDSHEFDEGMDDETYEVAKELLDYAEQYVSRKYDIDEYHDQYNEEDEDDEDTYYGRKTNAPTRRCVRKPTKRVAVKRVIKRPATKRVVRKPVKRVATKRVVRKPVTRRVVRRR